VHVTGPLYIGCMDNATSHLRRIEQLRDHISASRGWAVRSQIARIGRIGGVFQANWRELENLIGRFATDTVFALETWGRNGYGLDSFLNRVDAPLHNFLASSYTLGEYTQAVRKRLLGDAPDADRNCQALVDATFGENPRSRFVRDLRSYLTHSDMPVTFGSITFVRGQGTTHRVMLGSDALLRSDRWTQPSQEYIKQSGDQVDLYVTFDGYVEEVNHFQQEFQGIVIRVHNEVLEALADLVDEHDALVRGLHPQRHTS